MAKIILVLLSLLVLVLPCHSQSYYFDGSDDGLSVNKGSGWKLAGDYTIMWWQYPTGNTGYATITQSSNTFSGYILGYNTGSGGNILCYGSTSEGDSGSWDIFSGKVMGVYKLNVWSHIAITHKGITWYTYQDGIQQATWTDTDVPPNSTVNLRIAKTAHYSATSGFLGYLDEIMIFDGLALTRNQIVEYANRKPSDKNGDRRILYIDFNGTGTPLNIINKTNVTTYLGAPVSNPKNAPILNIK
jgi:hypothetical protein